MKKNTHQSGFTLVELAIVLVIIGLIVGGVLVGQDLIKAAQIRAAVGQVEKYDAAVNAFRGKYNGLPGDLGNCTNFFKTADCSTSTNIILSNSELEDAAGTHVALSGEVTMFWHHLYLASYIGDPITDTSTFNAAAAVGSTVIANVLPAAKVGNGNFFLAYTVAPAVTVYPGFSGTNTYRIQSISAISAAGAPTLANGLTPLEAFQFDTKKDDGVPNSGVVQATDEATNFNVAAETVGSGTAKCLASAAVYNTGTTNGVQNNRLCSLMVRGSW